MNTQTSMFSLYYNFPYKTINSETFPLVHVKRSLRHISIQRPAAPVLFTIHCNPLNSISVPFFILSYNPILQLWTLTPPPLPPSEMDSIPYIFISTLAIFVHRWNSGNSSLFYRTMQGHCGVSRRFSSALCTAEMGTQIHTVRIERNN
jgi:hypothetical protein